MERRILIMVPLLLLLTPMVAALPMEANSVVRKSGINHLGCHNLDSNRITPFRDLDSSLQRSIELSRARAIEWIRAQWNETTGLWIDEKTTAKVLSVLSISGYVHDAAQCSHSFDQAASILRQNILMSNLTANSTEQEGPSFDVLEQRGGSLAKIVLGMSSVCEDVRSLGQYNLIDMLHDEMDNFPNPGYDNFFEFSLGVVALSVAKEDIPARFGEKIIRDVLMKVRHKNPRKKSKKQTPYEEVLAPEDNSTKRQMTSNHVESKPEANDVERMPGVATTEDDEQADDEAANTTVEAENTPAKVNSKKKKRKNGTKQKNKKRNKDKLRKNTSKRQLRKKLRKSNARKSKHLPATLFTDTQAMALVAMEAVTRELFMPHWVGKHANRELNKGVKRIMKFLDKIHNQGGLFEGVNPVTLAWNLQALFSHEPVDSLDPAILASLMSYFMSRQHRDGSFGGLGATLDILPALSASRILQLKEPDCETVDASQEEIENFTQKYLLSLNGSSLTNNSTELNNTTPTEDFSLPGSIPIQMQIRFPPQAPLLDRQPIGGTSISETAMDETDSMEETTEYMLSNTNHSKLKLKQIAELVETADEEGRLQHQSTTTSSSLSSSSTTSSSSSRRRSGRPSNTEEYIVKTLKLSVPAGASALEALEEASLLDPCFHAELHEGDWGPFITVLCRREAEYKEKTFWAFLINGREADTGAKGYVVRAHDKIAFEFRYMD